MSCSAPLVNIVFGTRLTAAVAAGVRALLEAMIPGWTHMPPAIQLPLARESPPSLPRDWGFPTAPIIDVVDFPSELQVASLSRPWASWAPLWSTALRHDRVQLQITFAGPGALPAVSLLVAA